MSEWIIDRRPTITDAIGHCEQVFVMQAGVSTICHYLDVMPDVPWMPITAPEPYVKPKRYKVVQLDNAEWAILRIADDKYVAHSIVWNAREAAERIAEIYEEVMP